MLKIAVQALAGIVAWLFLTKNDGETETVTERITTNLGAVAIFAAGAIGVAYFWNNWRRKR